MPATLASFRTWLRLDLNDPAGVDARFSDAGLDRAVWRAVADLTLAAPLQTDTEHTCATASRVLDLSGAPYTGQLMEVVEVEMPYGVGGAAAIFPPRLVPFRLSADRLTLTLMAPAAPAAGEIVRLRWCTAHAVTELSSTVPPEWEAPLARGAAAYAMLAYSTPAADNFKYDDGVAAAGVDDSMIPKEWRARAESSLAHWFGWLERLRAGRDVAGAVRVVWREV